MVLLSPPLLLLLLLLVCGSTTPSQGAPLTSAAAIFPPRNSNNNNNNNNNSRSSLGKKTTRTAAAATTTTTTTTTSSAAWLDGLKNGLASALAAACVKTTLQPIDAIKTIQQYHHINNSGAATAATAAQSSLTVLAACREIMSSGPGGFWNFYAGLGVTVFGAMPGVALYFGVYSYCKKHLLQTAVGSRHKTASIAVSAAIGNSVASFSRVPYEVIKQKLQTKAYSSTWEAFHAIATSGQWLSIIFPPGGVAIQMIRDVPYAICTLMLYEYLKSLSATHRYDNNTTNSSSSSRRRHRRLVVNDKAWDFALGGIAGGVGSWVTTPMDVVKTRLQTDPGLYDGSVWKCTKALWLEGGAPVFLRGAVPRLMHKVPANAFFFLFYETFRKLLRVNDDSPL